MIDIPDSIFSSNQDGEAICPKCQRVLKECSCPSYDPSEPKKEQYVVQISLEKSGRRGKAVTLLSNLPADDGYLKKMTKQLKSQVGSGGTHYVKDGMGVIEIQGDRREALKSRLQKEGFEAKIK